MTKAEIVNRINEKTGIEKVAVMAIVEEVMASIKENMANGENVYLRGFGTFHIIERKEKLGRNISKNTSVVIPAHKIPKFKPSKEFMGIVK
jgi:DNA-binding protein HU-beta